jgi:hypothetical protein
LNSNPSANERKNANRRKHKLTEPWSARHGRILAPRHVDGAPAALSLRSFADHFAFTTPKAAAAVERSPESFRAVPLAVGRHMMLD